MAKCEYVDPQRGGINDYYCMAGLRGKVEDSSIIWYYCTNHVHCEHCPYRGGDDSIRKKDAAKEAEEQRRRQRDREEAEARYVAGRTSSGGGGSSRGSSRGGSSGSFGFLEFWGEIFRNIGIIALIGVVVMVLVFGADILGLLGPWVQMQIPETADLENLQLYSVSREGDWYFQVRTGDFDKDGLGELRTKYEHSDVYLEQDGASVWLGTCDLWVLNTGVVADITYEEAQEQMIRPLMVRLQDTDGNILTDAVLRVTDAEGQAMTCVAMAPGEFAVLLPNDMAQQTLTLQTEGFQPLEIAVDPTQRMTQMIVTLENAGGAQ